MTAKNPRYVLAVTEYALSTGEDLNLRHLLTYPELFQAAEECEADVRDDPVSVYQLVLDEVKTQEVQEWLQSRKRRQSH